MNISKLLKHLFLILPTFIYANDRLTEEGPYYFELSFTLKAAGLAIVFILVAIFILNTIKKSSNDNSLLKAISWILLISGVICGLPALYYIMAIIASIWVFGILAVFILGTIIILFEKLKSK